MKKLLLAVIGYVLIGSMIIGITIFGLIMWSIETESYGATKTNRQIVRDYAKQHYPKYAVKFDKHVTENELTSRKGTVLVEIIKSKSHGRHGYTRDGYYIKYNKRVKRGKTVTSYLIYNPKNNVVDDVVAVVDNRKVR